MKSKLLLIAGVATALALALAITERALVKPVLAQVRAALVQNVDEPGRTPFALFGSTSNSNFYSFSVPAGQRYVVETTTGLCFENTPGVLADISIYVRTGGVQMRASTQPHLQQGNGPTQNIYVGTGTQKVFADPASSIQLIADDNLSGGGIQACEFWVTGYVINNP